MCVCLCVRVLVVSVCVYRITRYTCNYMPFAFKKLIKPNAYQMIYVHVISHSEQAAPEGIRSAGLAEEHHARKSVTNAGFVEEFVFRQPGLDSDADYAALLQARGL